MGTAGQGLGKDLDVMVLYNRDLLFSVRLIFTIFSTIFTIVMCGDSSGSGTINSSHQVPKFSGTTPKIQNITKILRIICLSFIN